MSVLLDVLCLTVGILMVLRGIKRGFLQSLFKVCRLLPALWLAYLLGGVIGKWIGFALLSPTAHMLMLARLGGYVAVFVIAFILLSILLRLIKRIKEGLSLLNAADKLLGGAMGGIMALTVLFLTASAIKFFFGERDFYTNSMLLRALGDLSLGSLNLNEWLRKGITV